MMVTFVEWNLWEINILFWGFIFSVTCKFFEWLSVWGWKLCNSAPTINVSNALHMKMQVQHQNTLQIVPHIWTGSNPVIHCILQTTVSQIILQFIHVTNHCCFNREWSCFYTLSSLSFSLFLFATEVGGFFAEYVHSWTCTELNTGRKLQNEGLPLLSLPILSQIILLSSKLSTGNKSEKGPSSHDEYKSIGAKARTRVKKQKSW